MQKTYTIAQQISYLKLLIFINKLFSFLRRQIKKVVKKGEKYTIPCYTIFP